MTMVDSVEAKALAVDNNSGDAFNDASKLDSDGLVQILDEIHELGLDDHVREIDTVGYTVIPPELVGPPEFIDRLVEAGLEQAEKRLGVRPDLTKDFAQDSIGDGAIQSSPFGAGLPALLLEDKVFQEAILNRTSLAIATYLLGRDCVIDSVEVFLKGKGTPKLSVHADQYSPAPFPQYAQITNNTWALTDYTIEAGPTAFVPGSHRICRQPMASMHEGEDQLVPITAKRGSLIIWHGNTWHGALPRTAEGLRMQLITTYRRSYLQTTEGSRGRVTPEMYAQNPPRFRNLIGEHLGWARDPYTEDYNAAEFIGAACRLY